MRNLNTYINERLVLSKGKQSNKYITFKELALYKMRDFNSKVYGDGFNTEDWCTPDNIYHGLIKPYSTKDRDVQKPFTPREIENILPELSKVYREHEDDEFLIDDIKVKSLETDAYNLFKFEIEDYIFNWIIYKRTFNV